MKYELQDLKEERDDIHMWRATLKDGRIFDTDADTEKEAREKIETGIKIDDEESIKSLQN